MLVKFKCNLCSNDTKKLFQKKDLVPHYLQCSCGGIMEKQVPDFAMASYETVDNGNMPRRVELRKDAAAKAKEKGDNYIKIQENRDRITKKEEV